MRLAEFYLDTARFGLMCRGARLAERDFGRLVGRPGSSLYLEQFLANGYRSLPRGMRQQLAGLRCWTGVHGLREKLGQFTQQPIDCPSYFFSQSNSLFHFAAHQLFAHADRVLMTDLAWPPYRRCLQDIAMAFGKSLVVVPLYADSLGDPPSADDLERRIVARYQKEGCDGIFLSDITYLGIRMPLTRILRSLASDCCFSVIDGAQAFNHRPINLTRLGCDFYLAGSQKWLRSYHPLRIAFVGRTLNACSIDSTTSSHVRQLTFDPLSHFCEASDRSDVESFGETVNVSALIASAGALEQAMTDSLPLRDSWRVVMKNARKLAHWLDRSTWAPVTCRGSQSGILLLKHNDPIATDHAKLRHTMAQSGIIASAFPDGLIRLSMPRFTLSLKQMSLILKRLASLTH